MRTAEEVDRLREPLSRFVQGYLRDVHATEDVVQETLLRALRSLHRYRGRAALRTWVFSIARNLCRDQLRAGSLRLRKLDVLESRERGRALDSLRADPAALLQLAEDRDRLIEALQGLAPETREILVLRIYFGLSDREIARRRGGEPACIRSRLWRARRGLSLRLRQGG